LIIFLIIQDLILVNFATIKIRNNTNGENVGKFVGVLETVLTGICKQAFACSSERYGGAL